MPGPRRTVGDVMSADLVHVESHDSVTTVAAIMNAARVGSALVMKGETLQGIFTERDVLRALKRNPHKILDSPVGEWMSHDPRTVDPAVTVREALRLMLKGGFRHLPVVSENRVVGVVSLRDLARVLAG